MEQNTELGANKTGIDMSPIHSKKMLEASEQLVHDSMSGRESLDTFEQYYLENADALGSVPLPGTVKGVVKSTVKTLTGHHPEVFINKLGERLAYERTGIRVYEQLINKCEYTVNNNPGHFQVPIDLLWEFHNQEAEHFELLVNCIKKLGADPTAQTPDANASGVASSGLLKVISDPRTSISQSLQAMLAIELADNAAWELLIKLAEDMNLPDMAELFEQALTQENIHLAHVRQWYEESIREQIKMKVLS
jgi:rubrerythrin